MFNTGDEQSRKSLRVTIGAVVAFILVIVTISVYVMTLSNHEEARIVNEDANVNAETGGALIASKDMSRIKKELYRTLSGVGKATRDFDAAVRWSTFEAATDGHPHATFLVDIDEYQQTYRIMFSKNEVIVSCPEPFETKFPDSFCIGLGEQNDSIQATLGSVLPYTGKTSEGETFSVERSPIGEWKRPYLRAYARVCSATDETLERVRTATEELIIAQGGSPAAFEIQVLASGACHGE